MKAGFSFVLILWLLPGCAAGVLAQNPEAREHYSKGTSYLEQEMYEVAIKEYNEAIRIEPWYADAHLMLGIAYYCRGPFELAAKELENGIKLSGMKPRDAWQFATMQLLSLQRAGMVDEARQLLNEWSRVGGHLERDAKYLTGEWDEAKYLKKRKKERPHGNLVIGLNSLVKGNLERAKETLQLVVHELSEQPSEWVYQVAVAELEQIERCGQKPCLPQNVGDEELITIEEGKPEELYGVRTVYLHVDAAEEEELEYTSIKIEVVGAGTDWEYTDYETVRHTERFTRVEERENILKRLREYKSLTALDNLQDEKPDVMLVFRTRRFSGDRKIEKGSGVAFRFINGETMRILWKFRDHRFLPKGPFERDPSTNFARDFIKLHKKLHKNKKK